jgi:transcriptional regulator GlxA family with amidase domain
MAQADWLVDVEDTTTEDVSMEIMDAMTRLADDLTASTDLTAIAADAGLTYDTFRRRFAKQVGQTPPRSATYAGCRPRPRCYA